ncbi:MAG TPA: alpha/beta hydrolase [Janthinobacterium sp.]|nr:alpha/beta hydrolase [Janthinobacterium sp.]
MSVDVLDGFRVLLVPGLNNSGPGHWQSRWQALHPAFERVEQDDWDQPDLREWAARLDQVRARERRSTLLVAHSFGCLTSVASIAGDPRGIAGVLLVAPADPDKFGVAAALPHHELPCPSIVISSSDDPWMNIGSAALWARRWGSEFIAAGALGHINGESGLGDWPFGQARLRALAELALAADTLS